MASNDGFSLDLRNYKETVGAYVTPGRYLVVVEDAENGESAQKKTKQITLWLRVVNPGTASDGKTLVEALYLTDNARYRMVEFLQALGLKTPKQNLQFQFRQIINKRVWVTVEDNEYPVGSGKKRSRVNGYEQFDPAAGDAASVTNVQDFSDLDEYATNDGGVGTTDAVDDLPEEGEGEPQVAPAIQDEPEAPAEAEPIVYADEAPAEVTGALPDPNAAAEGDDTADDESDEEGIALADLEL